ncbi:hypothetical protein [Curtobacterium sp. NPDC089991]|uniref:hypothetical protein n=1 Tax=Curtobacterium sp. NPDC089991 TaxID=3363969 RepID=UPI0038091DA3
MNATNEIVGSEETETPWTGDLVYGLWDEGFDPVQISEALAAALRELSVRVLDGDFEGYEISREDFNRIEESMRARLVAGR